MLSLSKHAAGFFSSLLDAPPQIPPPLRSDPLFQSGDPGNPRHHVASLAKGGREHSERGDFLRVAGVFRPDA